MPAIHFNVGMAPSAAYAVERPCLQPLPAVGDAMVPLSSLVKVQEAVGPRQLNHFNQRRAVALTANLAPGYSLGEALAFMD